MKQVRQGKREQCDVNNNNRDENNNYNNNYSDSDIEIVCSIMFSEESNILDILSPRIEIRATRVRGMFAQVGSRKLQPPLHTHNHTGF